MKKLNIEPIHNVNVEDAEAIQICIVKYKSDVCDSYDGICYLG